MNKLLAIFLHLLAITTQIDQVNAETAIEAAVAENEKIKKLLYRYNNGFKEREIDTITSCLGSSFFRFSVEEGDNAHIMKSGHPMTWHPEGFYSSKEKIREWLVEYFKDQTPYENKVSIVQLGSAHLSFGTVVTAETGRHGTTVWFDLHKTWIVGKVNDEWKIQGVFENFPNTSAHALTTLGSVPKPND